MLNVNAVMAQSTNATPPPQQGSLSFLFPLAIIFFIFYFLLIRPQKRKLQAEQALLKSLAKGNKVYTKSGILGTIVAISPRVVTLEISKGVRLKIIKDQIGGLAKNLFEESPSKTAPSTERENTA